MQGVWSAFRALNGHPIHGAVCANRPNFGFVREYKELHGCGFVLYGYCARRVKMNDENLDAAVEQGKRDEGSKANYRADVGYISIIARGFDPLLNNEIGLGGMPFVSHFSDPSIAQSCALVWQLPVITASIKRRKLSPEASSSSPRTGRNDSRPPPGSRLPPRNSSSSNRQSKSSSSSPPRYVPAHLQSQATGAGSHSSGRSPTPATATAHLTLHSEHSDMPSDPQDTPPNGDARSPSPGEKRSASDITDSDPEGGVSMPTPMDVDVDGSDGPETRNEFDKQIEEVQALMERPLKDGERGFVVSMSWLKLVFARSTLYTDRADKEAFDKPLGPVDNSDLVLDVGPHKELKDEKGQDFVPLRPDLMLDQHYQILPAKAWHLIKQWYGIAEGSPTITRYAHETNPDGDSVVIYELRPPIISVFKLANPSAGTTPKTLKEKSKSPPKTVAGRQMSFQKWLKEAKQLLDIRMSTKVRVWKIRDGLPSANVSHMNTPSGSRTASPAPSAALLSSSQKHMLVDLTAFLSLDEGNQREVIEVKDQTDNPKYNGKMSLMMANLIETDAVVLEEQVGVKGEWISEASSQALKRLGIPVEKTKFKKDITPSTSTEIVPTASGRTSPSSQLPRGAKRPPGSRLGRTGLDNMGNTCYQNAATQCLRAVEELSVYFLTNSHKPDLNLTNVLGWNGRLASVYSSLLQSIYREPAKEHIRPSNFRTAVGKFNPIYSTWEQHDSQEFLSFVLDGLSEDLNTIENKPYIEKPDSTPEMVHDRKALEEFASTHWDIYTARNESPIVDLFSGMYKSTVECPVCDKVSIKFEPYTSLSLPIPHGTHIVYRDVIYVPIGQPPKKFTVEVSKSDNMKVFRQKVATRMGVDPDKIVGAEVTDEVFWSFYTNDKTTYYDLSLKAADTVYFYELDVAASEDRVLVPIFHRELGKKGENGSATPTPPAVLSFTKDETHNLGTIYRKILRYVDSMTTRDIFNDTKLVSTASTAQTEDSDTVELTEDDAKSADSQIKTASVDGDDNMIEVSMQNGNATAKNSNEDAEMTTEDPPHPLSGTIAPHLLKLFDVRILPSSYGHDIPTGRQTSWIKAHRSITSRIQSTPSKNSQTSSEDSSDDSSGSHSEAAQPVASDIVQDDPFIREREGIVISWSEPGRQALFNTPTQGEPTHSNPPYIFDQELVDRRAARDAKKAEGISIVDCLNEFNSEEILSEDDAWYCPQCKEFRQAKKKLDIWYAPDILIMHLKRFTSYASSGRGGGLRQPTKFDRLIDYPLTDLDISSYISGPSNGKSTKYDLFAIDCHSGAIQFGHYYAYAKNWVTGDWCEFNDDRANPIRGDVRNRIVSSSNYLLFYRRQSDGPLGGQRFEKAMNIYNGVDEQPSQPESTEQAEDMGTTERQSEHNPLNNIFDQPSWSFRRSEDDQYENDGPRLFNTDNLPGDINAEEDSDLFNDRDSNVAIEDGNSDAGDRLQELNNSGANSDHEATFEDVPTDMHDASDDDLPVVELKVGEEEKLADE